MVKSEDEEEISQGRFYVRLNKEIKDLVWILNQGPDQYRRFGKEEFETHPTLPLEGLRWEDQLNVYRLWVFKATEYGFGNWTYFHSGEMMDEMMLDKIRCINAHLSGGWGDYATGQKSLSDNVAEDEIYLLSCQLRDATHPQLAGQEDPVLNELHYNADFLAYLSAFRGSELEYRPLTATDSKDKINAMTHTLIRNNPAHTSYRQKRVAGAYQDLDKFLERIRND